MQEVHIRPHIKCKGVSSINKTTICEHLLYLWQGVCLGLVWVVTPPPLRGAVLGEAGLGMESAEVFYILLQNSTDGLSPGMMLKAMDEDLKTPTTNYTESTLLA